MGIVRPGHRSADFWDPHTVLVVGVGLVGLLAAALIGVQLGAQVHVLDRATSGPKRALVQQLGGSYHTGAITDLGLRQYYRAATALAAVDPSWLEQLVTRRVRPDAVQQALQRAPDDIKVIMEFTQP